MRKPDTPIRRVLARRDYRLILVAHAISKMGTWFYVVGLLVYLFDETGSAGWVAAAGVARLLPRPLFGSLAGVLADRYGRRVLMLAADTAQTVVMCTLAVTAALGGAPWIVVSLAFLNTAAGTPFWPAQGALIPEIVPEDELATANSVNSTVEHVALLTGPGLGGLILLVGPPSVAFAVNAASFAVSALLVLRVRHRGPRTPVAKDAKDARPASLLRDFREGLAALRGSAEVVTIVAIAAINTFQFGVESVVWVTIAERWLGLGSEGFGFLLAATGAGGVLAAAVTARLAAAGRPDRVVLMSALGYGLPLCALAAIRSPWGAYVVVAVEGAASIIFDVVVLTLLQRLVSTHVRGRVLGLFDSVIIAAGLLGLLVAPILVGLLGLTTAVVVSGLALPAATLAALPVLVPAARRAEQRRTELAPRVARLKALGILDGAGQAAYEAVAADLQDVRVRAGDGIVAEGEPADAVYLIVEGTFEVRSRGEAGAVERAINELGPGDHFGEIGVVQGIPRTATVAARTDGLLLRVEGSAFADAVTRAPAMPRALRDVMQTRLARTHPSRVATLPAHATPRTPDADPTR